MEIDADTLVAVPVGVGECPVGEAVAVGGTWVGVAEGGSVGLGVSVGVAVGDTEGVVVAEGGRVAVGESVGEGVSVWVGVGVGIYGSQMRAPAWM